MKRTLITLLALGAAAHAAPTADTPAQPIVDPSLASSASQAPAADVSKLTDPLATPAIPEANLPELKEAERNALGVFFDVNAGTQGIGFNVGYEFNRYIKMRLRTAFLSYSYDEDDDDVDFTAELNNNSTALLVDVHPFAGKFHISAGLNFCPLSVETKGALNKSKISAEGRDYFMVGDKVYGLNDGIESGWLAGKYSWRSTQPYLGIGWSSDGDGDRSLYFSFELGVNFIGSGKLEVSHSDGIWQSDTPEGTRRPLNKNILESTLREEFGDVFKVLDQIYVYPVMQIGIGFRF